MLWKNKNKRQRQAQMYFLVYFCQLISTFDSFIPSLQLTTFHFQSSVATSPFAPAQTVYVSSFIDFDYIQELARQKSCTVHFLIPSNLHFETGL